MAACGQQTAPTSSATDPTEPVSPTIQTTSAVTESASPTPTPTASWSSTPSATPSSITTSTARPAGLRGMLLSADELTGTWTTDRTSHEGETGAGSCQVTSMSTIGALSSLRRTFLSGDDGAVQVVAKFADPKSAWRSLEVLKSWRERCGERLPEGSTVSTLLTVNAAPAVGHRYAVIQPTDGATQYERVGLVRRGEYVSLIAFFHIGSAQSFPAGQDPATLAVKAIAPLLG